MDIFVTLLLMALIAVSIAVLILDWEKRRMERRCERQRKQEYVKGYKYGIEQMKKGGQLLR